VLVGCGAARGRMRRGESRTHLQDWTQRTRETPRVARLVARHRERSLPKDPERIPGSATIGTPRPTCSRVTTADGRSPGSRVTTFHRLPRTRESQWHDDGRFAAYSCGGSRSIGRLLARTAFPFDPRREPSGGRFRKYQRERQTLGYENLMIERAVWCDGNNIRALLKSVWKVDDKKSGKA
jgi:hypothetical protein